MRFAVFLALTLPLTAEVIRDGNRVVIQEVDGGIALEFGSPVSFQYERWQGSKPPARGSPLTPDPQTLKLVEMPDGAVQLTSRFLELTINHTSLTVRKSAGGEVAALRFPSSEGLRLKAYHGEQFYGLGETNAKTLNLRGLSIQSRRPLLLSSHGYGLYFPRGPATFDLAKASPAEVQIATPERAFQFYYGPRPKEILEQHAILTHTQADLPDASLSTRDEKQLPKEVKHVEIDDGNYCDSPRILNQLSLSGVLFPALDLGALGAREPLIHLLPFLYDSKGGSHPALEQDRKAWETYLIAYLREAHDRGLPFVRPLLIQFPQDAGLDARSDLYMIGDEVLVAPGCKVTEIELPRGSWTDLRTNIRYPGRQRIKNDPRAGLPIFAKAGSLIPLASARLELHYFPSLGAEFFVFEPAINEYSQFHAAPAVDFMRVESESQVARTCEWILHHVSKPIAVAETGRPFREASSLAALVPGSWFHDAATGNLHIVVQTAPNEDHIVNVSF